MDDELDADSDASSDVPEWPEPLPPPPPRPDDSDNEDPNTPERKVESDSDSALVSASASVDSSASGLLLAKGAWKKKTLLDAVTCRKSPLYDNCRLLAQDGVTLMAMISRKRYKWYLKRQLAEVVDHNSIRIIFIPRGPGGAEDGMTEKDNICVVCGSSLQLFRTYIVPHSYRSEFPPRMSMSQSHDVWAKASGAFRAELAREFNAPVNGVVIRELPVSNGTDCVREKVVNAHQAKSAAKALLRHSSSLPIERYTILVQSVAELLGATDLALISKDQFTAVADLPLASLVDKKQIQTHEKIVVDAFRGREQQLVEKWRQMFLDKCKPKFLPNFWRVDFIKKE
ncbi:Exonuclease 3'-5' domain-containing protein 2 [Physocladia obscura]|uniref:Exonuclease 3'-5' domain-containing protein 2 n=1 Tax=Physocladia obscura TaxID=109957 RepID=A0AAD5SXH6_9FUNG|nr:Exonuclease 3'-5' domain-containing protein 2 [Physocladia obscura]